MALKVGIQLFSVRDMMQEDPMNTIKKVAELGYKYIEPANHHALEDDGVGSGVSAEKLNQILEESGSQVVSNHIFPFTDENIDGIIAYNKAIGNKYLVFPVRYYASKEDVLELCEILNRFGKKCKEEGLMLLYHNHYQEFQQFDGKTVMDYIVELTDPQAVGLEIDTFWTMRAGVDPVDAIHHFGDRIKLLHQKDYQPIEGEPANLFEKWGYDMDLTSSEKFKASYSHDGFTEVGCGTMDIQSIINAANEIGSVEYIILEQDFTRRDQLESVIMSMESFKKYEGISWD